jgi:WD40 repeat protein
LACALAPAGAEIAAALKNGKFQVWSLAGKPLRSWSRGDSPVGGLFYAGERRIVAAAGGSVAVFDATSGQKLAGWEAHPRAINSIASSRDVPFLATASDDGTIKLWKPDGTLVRTLGGGPGEMQGVAIAPAGDRVAAAASDTNIYLFDTRTGAVQHVLDLDMSCYTLDFSPDGRMLAAGSVDGSVTLWNAESGASMGVLGRYPVPVGAVRFSPDGKRLAATSVSMNPSTAETEARIWDLDSRKETSIPLGIAAWSAVAFTPAGRPVVAVVHDRTISVWES